MQRSLGLLYPSSPRTHPWSHYGFAYADHKSDIQYRYLLARWAAYALKGLGLIDLELKSV